MDEHELPKLELSRQRPGQSHATISIDNCFVVEIRVAGPTGLFVLFQPKADGRHPLDIAFPANAKRDMIEQAILRVREGVGGGDVPPSTTATTTIRESSTLFRLRCQVKRDSLLNKVDP